MTAQPTSLVPQTGQPPVRQRDDGAVLIAVYHFLISGLFLLLAMLFTLPTFVLIIIGLAEDSDAFIGAFFTGFFALIWIALAILNLVVGYGVWTQRNWGRVAALALAVIRLINIPIGTIIGFLVLWYLFKEEVAAKFT